MNKELFSFIVAIIVFSAASVVSAQQSSWGTALKSAAQVAGQVAVQQLSPQAQTTLDQAKKLANGAPQENFIVTKAKEFLLAGNYQPALDLANYVITTLNSKSIDAKKIMADAQAALMKIAQEKLAQAPSTSGAQQAQAQAAAVKKVKTDVTQTGSTLKNLFGTTK